MSEIFHFLSQCFLLELEVPVYIAFRHQASLEVVVMLVALYLQTVTLGGMIAQKDGDTII